MKYAILNNHIYPKFLLTPIATAHFRDENNIVSRGIYFFGIRIIRLGIFNPNK